MRRCADEIRDDRTSALMRFVSPGRLRAVALATMMAASVAWGQTPREVDGDRTELPAVTDPLAPPPSRTPRAAVSVADYRQGDLLWENDRTAHRIYGRPLEATEPPSGSGIDAWGKTVPWPFMDRQLRTGAQHGYHGEGLDFFHVGTSRGAGGLGIWHDNKLWTSRNYESHRILRDGPDVADFVVRYAPWPVDVVRKVWETRRFTLPLGTNFTRMVSTIGSDRADPLIVGIGVGRSNTGREGEVTIDRRKGLISFWGPDVARDGRMAVALRVDPAMIVDVRQDADNHLLLLKVRPGKPFVYYSGAAWNKGIGGFRSRGAWDAYAAGERLDFSVPTPVVPAPGAHPARAEAGARTCRHVTRRVDRSTISRSRTMPCFAATS